MAILLVLNCFISALALVQTTNKAQYGIETKAICLIGSSPWVKQKIKPIY